MGVLFWLLEDVILGEYSDVSQASSFHCHSQDGQTLCIKLFFAINKDPIQYIDRIVYLWRYLESNTIL